MNNFNICNLTQIHTLFIQNCTPNSRLFEKIFIKLQPAINQTRIWLRLKLFYAAFDQTHSHGHSGDKLSVETFNQFYYNPHLQLCFFIFIHDCIGCQTINIFLINLKCVPHYLFMKKQLTLTTESLWTLKDQFLLHSKEILIFLS